MEVEWCSVFVAPVVAEARRVLDALDPSFCHDFVFIDVFVNCEMVYYILT